MVAKKKLGFGLFLIGVVFLFNFDIAVIDFLPDVIGYVLIGLGLSQLSYLSPRFEKAASGFRKMLIVGAVKLLSIIILFTFTNDFERPVGLLLFTFVFAVLEFIFLIPAFNEFFEGVLYVSTRFDGEAAYETRKNSPLTITERTKRFTAFFLILRAILTTLPEFASLTANSYDETTATMNLYEHIGLFRGFACIVVAIFGIVWLIKIERYLFKIKNDTKLFDALRDTYNSEIATKEGIFIKKTVKTAFIIAIFAFILFTDAYVDGLKDFNGATELNRINVIPDVVGAIVLFFSMLSLKKYSSRWIFGAVASLSYGFISALTSVAEYFFHHSYTITAVSHNETVYNAYLQVCSFSIIEALFSLIAIGTFILVIFEIIDKYTVFDGVSPTADGGARVREIRNELKRRFIAVGVCAVISAATEIWYNYSAITFGGLLKNFQIEEIVWIFNLLASIALVVSVVFALNPVREQNENRYMLD